MSKVRKKKIDCGPFGHFVLLSGEQDDVIEYLTVKEKDVGDTPSEDLGGFVARFPSNNLYIWLDADYSLTESIPHEAFHMATSLILRTAATPVLSCSCCEEMLALLVGHVSEKITAQLDKWQT